MPVDTLGRKFAISRIPQAASGATPAYQNPTAAANGAFVDLTVSDENIADFGTKTVDNAGYSTGSDIPNDQYTESHDVTVQHQMRMDSEMMGRVHLGTFGQIVTTQPDAVNVPAAYKHVSTPLDPASSRQLPPFSYLEYLGPQHDVLFPSCIFQQMELSGDDLDRINLGITLRGSGKRISPSGVTFSSAHVTKRSGLKYWMNTQKRIILSDPATLLNNYDPACDLLNFKLSYNNNPVAEDGYLPGCLKYQDDNDPESGAVRSELLFGARSIVPSLLARMSEKDYYDLQKRQVRLDWLIELFGPKIGSGFTVANPGAAPTLSDANSGGSIPAGTYYVVFAYVNAWGETIKSAEATITIASGTANTITVTAAVLPTGATGIRVYIGTATGVHKYAGSSATNALTLTALPTSGVSAPTVNRTTARHKATYRGHFVSIATVNPQVRNGIVLLDITPKILRDSSGNTITAEVINETASYLS
ncbi:MAG TPA: hypothetical protein VEF04_03020 [Blastocatellia bacterium]|nr:hypothetical protein [Blastocatellia bacterium]